MTRLHEILSAIWTVWFVVVFVTMLVWVLRPGRREVNLDHANIPFRSDPN